MNLDSTQHPQYFVPDKEWDMDENLSKMELSVTVIVDADTAGKNAMDNDDEKAPPAVDRMTSHTPTESAAQDVDMSTPPVVARKSKRSLTHEISEDETLYLQRMAGLPQPNAARTNNDGIPIEMELQAQETDGLPEKFWDYCEEWTPRFEGVQQYLLQGFLRPQFEELCLKVIKDALVTKMDNIMDRSNLRPCLALIAILPFVCYHSRRSPEKLTDLPLLLLRLQKILSGTSKKWDYQLEEFAKGGALIEEDLLLKKICPIFVEQFFNPYAKIIANYLNGLLESPGMEHYYPTIYRITRYLLEYGIDFLLCFETIIVKAHKVVSGGTISQDVSDAATELVKIAIEHVKSNKGQRFSYDFIDVSPFPEAGLKFIFVYVFIFRIAKK
ncbi:hypothetical protein RFI_05129 [Reticulomyxa filosa]|uniref:Cell morphogenesis protein C-terminal domain-containing protein n=1 Tax=Reticulomyxa filosa TaxID=46433 RepID=X6P177_RETFI|nr:hypothetical protein RFI_05129 [Reticulomyxa filosa]|eukprot:ETO31986.1 hypothetical protein RFI_05129 [Reticulomyxa filosa]